MLSDKKETIKKMVEDNCYLEFGDHVDLKALCICPFADDAPHSDYEEIAYIVPTEWLKLAAKELFDVDELDYWLINEYTTDQSENIFEKAVSERKVVMIDFN